MNLLNKSNPKNENERMRVKLLEVLGDADLSEENMKVAVEFFDFDKEINLELLDKVTLNTVKNTRYFSSETIRKLMKNKERYNSEYLERYILFAEAVYGSKAYRIIADYGYGYNFMYEIEENNFDEIIVKALSRRFGVDVSWSKLFAMIAESKQSYDNIILSDYFMSNPGINKAKNILNAWKYCTSGYSEMLLYSIALQMIEADDIDKDEELAEIVKLTLEKIFKALNTEDKNNHSIFMIAGFVASKFSNPIKERMKVRIAGNENKALNAILSTLDNGYIDLNISRLYDIFDIGENSKFTKQSIETAAICCFLFNKGGASSFLCNISVTHPDEFIEVMLSDKSMSTNKQGTYTFYSARNASYCSYLPEMYRIISTQNEDALEKAGFIYKDAILECTINVIKGLTKRDGNLRKAIEEYLLGKRNLDVLEPVFESLSKNFMSIPQVNANLITNCIKVNPEFKKRYYTFLAIAEPAEVGAIIVRGTEFNKEKNKTEERIRILREFIMAFAEEKLPDEICFKAYEAVFENYYIDNEIEIERLIKKIAKFMTGSPERYAFCKKLGVASRKIYLKYLELNNEDNKYKAEIFDMCSDSSKEIRNRVISVIAKNKENESDVLEMLKAKKGATREIALGVLELWGAENYNDILLEMAETEKVAKIVDKIQTMLATSTSGVLTNGDNVLSTSMIVETLHKGGRNKKVLWLFETPNSAVHFNNDAVADDRYLQAILLCYSNMTDFGISQEANILAQDLKKAELENFVLEIFMKWIQAGAESKKKWVLYFAGIHGGFNMIEVLQKYIKEWSENSRGAIAADAVMALALNGSSDALMAVDNMAHKFKHKQVKSAANKALQNAADALGITSDELGDRIVPNLGFDENMERIFDYGTRKFKVYLNTALELEVYDEKDKKLKTLPSVGAKDTEDIAKASNAEFKQMKKQLKNVVAIQKLRLETAMLADRRWNVTAWNDLFVKNPVMHKFAMGLIWVAYENNEAVQTFRYMEDGTFNTYDEDEYELSDNCTIGLAHPIDLDEETLSAWKEQLSDYEIVQPIEQLNKTVYTVTDEEKGKLDLTRFNGREINGYTLLNRMTKMGWYKGSVLDAGCFFTFYREDITKRIDKGNGVIELEGNAVELRFSGMYVSGEDDNMEIETVRFYKPGAIARGSYVYDEAKDEKSIKLDRVAPRYFSEIISQLDAILKVSNE